MCLQLRTGFTCLPALRQGPRLTLTVGHDCSDSVVTCPRTKACVCTVAGVGFLSSSLGMNCSHFLHVPLRDSALGSLGPGVS